jgi:hypothetical protein
VSKDNKLTERKLKNLRAVSDHVARITNYAADEIFAVLKNHELRQLRKRKERSARRIRDQRSEQR